MTRLFLWVTCLIAISNGVLVTIFPDQKETSRSDDYPSGNFQKAWFKNELDQMRSEFTMELNRKLKEQEDLFNRKFNVLWANRQRDIDRLTEQLHNLSENKQRDIDRLTEQLHNLSENKQRDIDRLTEQLHNLSENKQRDIDKLAEQVIDLSRRLNENIIGETVHTSIAPTQKGCLANNGKELGNSTQNPNPSQSSALYSGSFVGFMASPLDHYYYSETDRIIFDNVILDSSNSYNATDSAFTCPFSGYYQFTVTIANLQEADKEWKRIDAQLYIGDTAHIKAIAAESPRSLTQSTVQVVNYCSEQEQVYVEAHFDKEYQGEERGIHKMVHSSFSGYLIALDN